MGRLRALLIAELSASTHGRGVARLRFCYASGFSRLLHYEVISHIEVVIRELKEIGITLI